MRIRRTVKERDIMKVWVFGYDRKLIKSAADSGFRNMSEVLSYANCMAGDKPVDHIRVSNENRGWCGSYTIYGREIDRYTIICVSDKGKDSNGLVYYPVFACSENPFHPQGIGIYVGDYYPYRRHSYDFGKRVKNLASLPKEVIKYIKIITI